MQYGIVPAGLIASARMEVMNPPTATSPLGSWSSVDSMPAQDSQQEWALQSLRAYATPSSNGILSTQTNGSVETKPEAMEIMTIPVIGDNHENYSGEGKDHIEESYSLPEVSITQSSPQRGISEEENDTDGSGGNDFFISKSQTKQVTMEAAEEHNVLIQTTVQWKLLDLPTKQPSHSASVFKDTTVPKEARGEILYMHRPTEKSGNTPFKMIKVPLVQKKLNTHTSNASEISTPYMATTSEVIPKTSSTTDQTLNSNTVTTLNSQIQTTDATTAGDTVSTTDTAIIVTWLPVVQEETQAPQTHVPTTVTSVRLETTSDTVQVTTPDVKEMSQQAETEPETQLAPTTGSTSGDHTSQAKVDYENSSSASASEFLVLFCYYILHTSLCDTVMISLFFVEHRDLY